MILKVLYQALANPICQGLAVVVEEKTLLIPAVLDVSQFKENGDGQGLFDDV